MNRWLLLSMVGAGCLLFGVLTSLRAQEKPTPPDPTVPGDALFQAELLKATAGYERWWCATEVYPHVAPSFCSIPPPVPSVRMSKAPDQSPHGKKLYYLFVKNRLTEAVVPPPPNHSVGSIRTTRWYEGTLPEAQPIGQVFVKQAWTAIDEDYERLTKVTPAERKSFIYERRLTVPGFAINHTDKTACRPGEQRELFVMMKLDPAAPDTDQGWVYGVLSYDGKRVLHAGRIESCMECHLDAPHDRLFGLN